MQTPSPPRPASRLSEVRILRLTNTILSPVTEQPSEFAPSHVLFVRTSVATSKFTDLQSREMIRELYMPEGLDYGTQEKLSSRILVRPARAYDYMTLSRQISPDAGQIRSRYGSKFWRTWASTLSRITYHLCRKALVSAGRYRLEETTNAPSHGQFC